MCPDDPVIILPPGTSVGSSPSAPVVIIPSGTSGGSSPPPPVAILPPAGGAGPSPSSPENILGIGAFPSPVEPSQIEPERRPPYAVTKPVVIGDMTISGQTISATAAIWRGDWSTVSYQWLRSGVAISGATAATYVTQLADAGHHLARRDTVLGPLGSGTVTSVGVMALFPAVASGLQIRLDAHGLSYSNGAAITTIPDRSGNGRTATKISGNWTFEASGPSGKPWIRAIGGSATTASFAQFPAKRGTVFVVTTPNSNQMNKALVGTYDGTDPDWVLFQNWQSGSYKIYHGGTFGNLAFQDVAGRPAIQSMTRSGDTTVDFRLGHMKRAAFTVADSQQAANILRLGNGDGVDVRYGEVLQYDRALSDAEIAAVTSALCRKWFGATWRLLITDGNSNTAGYGISNDADWWPEKINPGLGGAWDTWNIAVSGQTMPAMLSDFSSQVTPVIASVAGAGGEAYYVAWEGTNSITSGNNLATLQGHLTNLLTAAKSAGATKTIAPTILKAGRFTEGQEIIRQQFNAWIMSGSSGADIVVDVASAPEFQTPSDGVYFSDDAHPTAAGCTVIKNYLLAALI